ncbi:MAG: Arm DNA-binding domain-containing protein [Candidatus Endonucleobacter sp. (ex Gigantidas childressi)]|nr:Arm DNA-binding domain-containing protein [Candidatus Endonucleobacter sp. (ex Gigantidas childressi)]
MDINKIFDFFMPPLFVAEYCGDRCMLTDTKIRTAKSKGKTYRLADFEGLYLEVSPTGGKYWRLKYLFNKKEKRLAIGVYPRVSLKEARTQKYQAKTYLLKA